MFQESRHSLAGSSSLASHKWAIKMLSRAMVSSEGLGREGSASKLTHMAVTRIQSLKGVWTEVFVLHASVVGGLP